MHFWMTAGHFFKTSLLTEAILCVCGMLAISIWVWRAAMDPLEGSREIALDRGIAGFRPSSPVDSLQYAVVKRVFDIVVSALMLAVVLIPCCMIAAIIAATSKGSVFYREKRVGRNGNIFRIWKFRSMYVDADRRIQQMRAMGNEEEHHFFWRTSKHETAVDPRITPIGHFIRRWSLDELPQLLNVLMGEMSLIGPRPVIPAELELYGNLAGYYMEVTPGLSGLWQVSGRSNVGYAQRANLDSQYARQWSLMLDMKILLRTLPVVLKRVGAK